MWKNGVNNKSKNSLWIIPYSSPNPFKERDIGAYWNYIYNWGREFRCKKKKEGIFFEVEKQRMRRLFRIYWNLVRLLALQNRVGDSNEENWGDNRMKKF